MLSANIPFAQAVVGPSPVPMPQATVSGAGTNAGGGESVIGLGPLLDALKPENLFGGMLTVIGGQLEDAATQLLDGLWHNDVNVFTYTAPELTYAFPPIDELLTVMRVLVAAVTAVAVVLAAASLAGREVFGWGDNLGEHLGRIGLAATLANGAPLWVKLAIDWNNALCEAIGSTALTLPGDRDHQTFAIILLILALVWFGFRLGLRMLYRIGMLWVLIPTAPVALACWAIPQTQWVAKLWTRLFRRLDLRTGPGDDRIEVCVSDESVRIRWRILVTNPVYGGDAGAGV